jgi:Abortive infection C-terminus
MESLTHLETDYELCDYLKDMLVSFATSDNEVDDAEYKYLRDYFLKKAFIKSLIPSWIQTNRNLKEFWHFIKFNYKTYAERRTFIWSEFEPALSFLESQNNIPSAQVIGDTIKTFNSDEISNVWSKALERQAHDPEGAITSARSLLESVCKHILDDLQITYDSSNSDISDLYRSVAKELNLAPSQHTAEIFRQILGGCSSVVGGLAGLRNKLGDAHGNGKNQVKPSSRHAKLAVNLSGSISLFLIETLATRKTAKS